MKKMILSTFTLMLMIPANEVFAAPVNNDIALTVFKGQFLIREQFIYQRKSGDDSPLDEKEHEIKIPTVLAYGLTQDVSLQLTIPYIYRELKQTRNGRRVTRKTEGLGDLKLVGKYEFYENDTLGKTENAAIQFGMEIPTGDTNDKDSFGPIERKDQVGHGSWNPMVMLAYNWETFRHEIDFSFMYHWHTKAKGYDFGDRFHHNASYQFRVWPWDLEKVKGLPAYLFLGVELNGMWHQKDESRLGTEDTTGGYVLYASPTIQFITRRYIIESSIQLPVIQAMNGEQTETDIVMRVGFRLQF